MPRASQQLVSSGHVDPDVRPGYRSIGRRDPVHGCGDTTTLYHVGGHIMVLLGCEVSGSRLEGLRGESGILVLFRTLQRKLRKLVHPKKADLSDGELSAYNDGRPKPRHGPLVGMYFLAWGLPAMPCAFTLPLRMDSYTANEEL